MIFNIVSITGKPRLGEGLKQTILNHTDTRCAYSTRLNVPTRENGCLTKICLGANRLIAVIGIPLPNIGLIHLLSDNREAQTPINNFFILIGASVLVDVKHIAIGRVIVFYHVLEAEAGMLIKAVKQSPHLESLIVILRQRRVHGILRGEIRLIHINLLRAGLREFAGMSRLVILQYADMNASSRIDYFAILHSRIVRLDYLRL